MPTVGLLRFRAQLSRLNLRWPQPPGSGEPTPTLTCELKSRTVGVDPVPLRGANAAIIAIRA